MAAAARALYSGRDGALRQMVAKKKDINARYSVRSYPLSSAHVT